MLMDSCLGIGKSMQTTLLVAQSLHIMLQPPACILVFYRQMQLTYMETVCQAPHHSHLPPTAPPPDLWRPQETMSRDQRGKIEMFFSSTGAFTAAKSPNANHHGHINAQLYSASITQIFGMWLFVKVQSVSSKLLTTASKSGPNRCKERSRPQKMLMRIKTEGLLGR